MRVILYIIVILFSLVLFGLSAARLHYTLHLPGGDPLHHGVDFYDPIVAELLVTSILIILVSLVYLRTITAGYERKRFTHLWFELALLFILWIMLLVGAAISTSIWPNLLPCGKSFAACRLLTALVAFCWLTWIALSALLVQSTVYAYRYEAWGDQVHSYSWRRGRGTRTQTQEVKV